MTLSQYAARPSNFFATNTTLLLLPGNHTLSSTLRVTGILHMEMSALTTFHTQVLCENSVSLEWTTVGQLYVSGLKFIGCTLKTLTSVEDFRLENCTLRQGQYRYEPLVAVQGITDVQIVASTFTGLSQRSRAITVYNSHLNVIRASFSGHHVYYNSIVYAFNTTIEIESSTFTDNTVEGGYLIDADHSIVTICNSTFSLNVEHCCSSSAVLMAEDSTLIFEHSSIGNNRGNWMRGISTANSNITINGSTFTDNNIQHGVVARNSDILIESCTFKGNVVENNGGVLNTVGKHIIITNSSFSDNAAGQSGGVVCANDNSITITSSTFANNTAGRDGGVLFAYRINLTITDGTLFNNTADERGGAVKCNECNVIFTHVLFQSNKAERDGGAVAASRSVLTIVYSMITQHLIMEVL